MPQRNILGSWNSVRHSEWGKSNDNFIEEILKTQEDWLSLFCRRIMDKFVIIGGILCFTADVFAIAALVTPKWVVSEFSGIN